MSDQTAITPYSRFRDILKNDDVQERFRQLLDKRAPEFLSGLLSLVNADQKLLACQPSSILASAAKAAILRLPIAKELGFAYIVPFKDNATFILGYKGMIQLAIRTGQYHAINAAEIYEGEEIIVDRLTGGIKLNGKRTGDTVTGYVAYFKLKNGFEKFIYLSKEDTERHALRYSKSYQYGVNGGKKDSAWFTNFDDMGKKTVLRILLSRYGLMSIEMQDEDAPPLIGSDPRITGEQDIPVPAFDDVLDGHFEDATESEPERPYLPAALFAKIEERSKIRATQVAPDRLRKAIAATLDTIFDGEKTKRYELCKWLTGKSSTKDIPDAYVHALSDWLGVTDFSQPPHEHALTEARTALAEALKAAGQQELL